MGAEVKVRWWESGGGFIDGNGNGKEMELKRKIRGEEVGLE